MAVFEKVYEIVQQVPKGKVVTYGTISKMLGGALTAQGVGWALKALSPRSTAEKKYSSSNVPWYRVVNSKGGISTTALADEPDLQKRLLQAEGVRFNRESGLIDLSKYEWQVRKFDGDDIAVTITVKKKSGERSAKNSSESEKLQTVKKSKKVQTVKNARSQK